MALPLRTPRPRAVSAGCGPTKGGPWADAPWGPGARGAAGGTQGGFGGRDPFFLFLGRGGGAARTFLHNRSN